MGNSFFEQELAKLVWDEIASISCRKFINVKQIQKKKVFKRRRKEGEAVECVRKKISVWVEFDTSPDSLLS